MGWRKRFGAPRRVFIRRTMNHRRCFEDRGLTRRPVVAEGADYPIRRGNRRSGARSMPWEIEAEPEGAKSGKPRRFQEPNPKPAAPVNFFLGDNLRSGVILHARLRLPVPHARLHQEPQFPNGSYLKECRYG
jgi:hypothetical protein